LLNLLLASGFHAWLGRWAPLAEWAVAFGTIILAGATYWLGRQARGEGEQVRKQADAVGRQADAVAEQVKIGRRQLDAARRQLEASQRPFVLPMTEGWYPERYFPTDPMHSRGFGAPADAWMALSNAGNGPAYNVRGAVFYPGGIGGGWQLVPTALAAGRELPVLLEEHPGYQPKWAEASGYLLYVDLARTEWQTHFRFHQKTTEQWWVEVLFVGKTEDLDTPRYTLEGGWQNTPEWMSGT
jgi:hypothetical protein